MLSAELTKYVALQLLVLAGSMNEEVMKTSAPIIPLTFVKSLAPLNLQALIADAEKRVEGVTMVAASAPIPAAPPAAAPAAAAQAPAAQAAPAAGAAAAHAPAAHAAAAPAKPAPAAHAAPAPPKGRRKRDVSGIISELADTVADVSDKVGDSPLAAVPVIGTTAQVVESASLAVEDVTKPETTALGELILSA